MAAFTDITGQRFGKLVALRLDGRYANNALRWLLQCDCGAETHATIGSLRGGQQRQCRACYWEAKKTHGQRKTRLYSVWSSMRTRCENPKHVHFNDYGGRGIAVCAEWRNFQRFADWAKNHGYSDQLQIDRIDNDRGYEPTNCRFVSPAANTNNRRCTERLSFFGEEMTLADAAREFGFRRTETLKARIAKGMTPESAVLTPIRQRADHLSAGTDTPQCKEPQQ